MTEPTYPAGTPMPPGSPPPAPTPAQPEPRNTLGLIALVAAVVGFVFACIPGALVVGWVLLPIAGILAIVSFFRPGRKRAAVCALILAIVGTIVGVVVFLTVVSAAVDDAFDDPSTAVDPDGADPQTEGEEPTTNDPAETETEADSAGFDPITESGSGDAVIELDDGVTAGIVTATSSGDSNFTISALDADNQPTGDLLVNTIGAYEGTTAFGLSSFAEAAALEVIASGDWSLTIAPLSAAPALQLPAEGSGDAVYSYDGDAATVQVTHGGESNFTVTQHDETFPDVLINEIGPYDGTVAMTSGPSMLVIVADGQWRIG